VVGASNAPHKYGNIITRNLSAKGYTVLPVNPHEARIAGLPVVPKLADLSPPPDLVVFVTQPEVTLQVLAELAALPEPLPLAWLQDGAFDGRVLAATRGAAYETVDHACVMVVAAAPGAGA
jgi:predicted CoA-binding protein